MLLMVKTSKGAKKTPRIVDPYSQTPKRHLRFHAEHSRKMPYDGQYHSSGKISIGDKAMGLSRAERRRVIMHEVGHELADRMTRDFQIFKLANSGAFGTLDAWGTPAGFSGIGERPDEFVADAYAYILEDPQFLKRRFPVAYKEIKKRATMEGFPVTKTGFDAMMGKQPGSQYRKLLSKPVKDIPRPRQKKKGIDPSLFRVDW